MLADPLAIAANAPTPALNLSMIRQDGYGSERRDVGGVYSTVINHSTGPNGDRHYVKVTQTIDATNPYNAVLSKQSASVSLSFASPKYGFDATAMAALYALLVDVVTAATPEQLLNYQS